MQSMNLMNFYCLSTKWKDNIFCCGKNSLVASAVWLSFCWCLLRGHKKQWGIPFPLSAELACLISSFLEDVFLGSLTPFPVWRKWQKRCCLLRSACDDALKLAPNKWLWKNLQEASDNWHSLWTFSPISSSHLLLEDYCPHSHLGH